MKKWYTLVEYIRQDNKEVINKILFGTEKMTRTDKKVTLYNMRFNLNACKDLSAVELDALSNTASNFFRYIQAIGTIYLIRTKTAKYRAKLNLTKRQ